MENKKSCGEGEIKETGKIKEKKNGPTRKGKGKGRGSRGRGKKREATRDKGKDDAGRRRNGIRKTEGKRRVRGKK